MIPGEEVVGVLRRQRHSRFPIQNPGCRRPVEPMSWDDRFRIHEGLKGAWCLSWWLRWYLVGPDGVPERCRSLWRRWRCLLDQRCRGAGCRWWYLSLVACLGLFLCACAILLKFPVFLDGGCPLLWFPGCRHWQWALLGSLRASLHNHACYQADVSPSS